jgi:uncharacterized protein with PIN domain
MEKFVSNEPVEVCEHCQCEIRPHMKIYMASSTEGDFGLFDSPECAKEYFNGSHFNNIEEMMFFSENPNKEPGIYNVLRQQGLLPRQ